MLHRMQADILQVRGQAIGVLLAEMQSEAELFASPATLQCVEAELLVMAQTLAHLAAPLHDRLPTLDWHGWQHLHHLLENKVQPRREAVWYGIQALVPATLALLAKLRRQEPQWFGNDY